MTVTVLFVTVTVLFVTLTVLIVTLTVFFFPAPCCRGQPLPPARYRLPPPSAISVRVRVCVRESVCVRERESVCV